MRIAIVGSGVAGAATALLLHGLGVEVHVFEAVAQPAPIGAGLLLQPTGQGVLGRMGLLGEVAALGARIDRLYGDTPQGKPVLAMRYDQLGDAGYPNSHGIGIQRGALMGVLWQAMRSAGVDWQCNVNVDRWAQDAQGVRVFAQGACLGQFDGLVIANGTFSKLRQQMQVQQSESVFPWGAWWAVLPQVPDIEPNVLRQRFRHARQMVGVMPVGRGFAETPEAPGGVNFFWSVPGIDLQGTELSAPALAHLKAQATDLFPDLKALLAGLQDPAQLRPARYADVRMARWHDGAVLAMGDCAHAMSPQLGQGANMALMDAWVLRNCLQTAWAESDQTSASPVAQWASAIASYSAQRQSHIRFYQQASFALTPLFQSNQRLLPALRDKLMHPMSKIPLVQQHNVATLAGLKTGWLWGRLTPPTS